MKTKSTDREVLVKGIQQMGIAVFFMFSGPTLLHLILTNKDRPFFIPLLIVAITLCGLAIFFAFKGINTIMDSFFKTNKTR